MKDINKFFWSIPALAIYAYVITVLFQFGFLSYFNIPSNFVEASLRSNIFYFYLLSVSLADIFKSIGWWWLLLGPILAFSVHFYKRYAIYAVTIVLVVFAIVSVSWGLFFGAHASSFLVPSENCLGDNIEYIIPGVYNEEVILVPIDQDRKMIGGFLVKNISELACKLDYRNIGLIYR
jgi:hypothetical protein